MEKMVGRKKEMSLTPLVMFAATNAGPERFWILMGIGMEKAAKRKLEMSLNHLVAST